MSTPKGDRHRIGSGSQGQNVLPMPSSRPSSGQAMSTDLGPKQTFLEYKSENRKDDDRSYSIPLIEVKREERRKSETKTNDVDAKYSEPTPMPTENHGNKDNENMDYSLPLKIFDGTKKAITDVSEHSRSYFWLRRIKEIFLQMGTMTEPFVEFDMSLARADMLTACDVYLRNDFSKLKNKGVSTSDDREERGLIQKIEESVKQLRNADALLGDINNSGSVVESLRSSTNQLMLSIQSLQQNVNNILAHLENSKHSKETINALRQTLRLLPKETKSQLKIRQEWDLKKLYAEVFKISYVRNELRTFSQKDELKPVKKGNDEPNFRNAIWWYSCNEASIYYQINSILKIENFELLMSYRYYISDLCKMIEYMHSNEQSQGNKATVFYRAASISSEQLEQMKKTLEEKKKGQLISMNGFTSTTANLDIAKRYARTQSLSSGNVRVLFKISVVPDKPCAAHAYIGNISFHPEEEETLFSMSSTFSIDKIEMPGSSSTSISTDASAATNMNKDEVNYYTIHVTACDVDKVLLDDIRAKIQECSASQLAVLLARYMLELGEYRAARKYLTALCSETHGILKDDLAIPNIYNCLGMTFFRQNLYADAIEYYKKALDYQARIGYSNNNALAEIYNNIGLSYIGLKLMDEAQAVFEEAERIQLREPTATRTHIASIYANIAYVHYAKQGVERDLDESENYFEKAMRIYQKATSKITHDAIERALLKAECYSNYGHLLSAKKTSNAQEYYDEALKIYKKILPERDPKLMRAHMNIMMEHAHHSNFEEVIELYEDSTMNDLINKRIENLFALDNIVTLEDLILLLQIVGVSYIRKGQQFFKAIKAWERAYELERKTKIARILLPMETVVVQWSRIMIEMAYHEAYTHFMSDEIEMPDTEEPPNIEKQTSLKETKKSKSDEQYCLNINYIRGFLCAKLHLYEDAIKHLKNVLSEDESFYANILLAEIFFIINDHRNAQENYLKGLQNKKSRNDQALLVEISLAQMGCYDDYTKATEKLKQLESSLNINDIDITRTSLKAIIYDMLAHYYLESEKHSACIHYAEKLAIPLKMRSLSHYHPSLAKNHLQLATAYVGKEQHSNAVKSFENAIEIQRLNLANDHLDIKLVYYQMGDLYCKMNQLDQAREKYEFAETGISEDSWDETSDNSSVMNRKWLLARASMNTHLATVYGRRAAQETAENEIRKGDCATAIEHQLKVISNLEELYPFENLLSRPSVFQLVTRLTQLGHYNERQGDVLVLKKSHEADISYRRALAIQFKTLRHTNARQGEIYRKIGYFYEHQQEDQESAINYYQEAIDYVLDTETVMATYYAVGRLMEDWKKDSDEAREYYKQAYNCIADDDEILKSIIQEKCPACEELASTRNDEEPQKSDENENNETAEETVKNVQPILEPSTDNLIQHKAKAYERLNDMNGLTKYCESKINESLESDIKLDFEVPDYLDADSNQKLFIEILTEILGSCTEHIRPFEVTDESNISTRQLSDAYLYWAHALKKEHMYNKAIEKYLKAFTLNTKLVDEKKLDTAFIQFVENLKAKKCPDIGMLISEYITASPREGTRLWLQVATAYLQEDYESDHSFDAIDASINACLNALNQANQYTPELKAVCHYALLRIYKDLRYADDQCINVIKQMAEEGYYKKQQDNLTVFDQRILSSWIHDIIEEYNERCSEDDHDEIPSNLVDEFMLPSLDEAINEEHSSSSCLGDRLMAIKDYEGSEIYWRWIIDQCESFYSAPIRNLIYDQETTIDQLVAEFQQLQNNANDYLLQMMKAHQQLASYYAQAAELPDVSPSDAVNYYESAICQCERAIARETQAKNARNSTDNSLQTMLKDLETKLDKAKTIATEDEEETVDNDDTSDEESPENKDKSSIQ